MIAFVKTKEFERLNIGFALDEGIYLIVIVVVLSVMVVVVKAGKLVNFSPVMITETFSCCE